VVFAYINFFVHILSCVVPKIFPTLSTPPGYTLKNMKLTRRKIRWLIKRKKEGMSSRKIAKALKISKRRVNQVWRMYMQDGEIPVIGRILVDQRKRLQRRREELF